MRRVTLASSVVVLLLAAAGPAAAAPRNGHSATEIVMDCGEAEIVVLAQFDTGAAAVFDARLTTNGRWYVLSFLDDRIYAGEHESEPVGPEPVFASTKHWGERKGFGQTLECSGSLVFDVPDLGPFTWFGDVIASGK